MGILSCKSCLWCEGGNKIIQTVTETTYMKEVPGKLAAAVTPIMCRQACHYILHCEGNETTGGADDSLAWTCQARLLGV
eukprot:scaffold128953_cov18-Tisochrysis_lutea.AAC.1